MFRSFRSFPFFIKERSAQPCQFSSHKSPKIKVWYFISCRENMEDTKQRQHFRTVFQTAYSTWGLAKQVCVYAACNLTLCSKDLIWPEENLLYKFEGREGNGCHVAWPISSHKGIKDGIPVGAFHKIWIFQKDVFFNAFGAKQI